MVLPVLTATFASMRDKDWLLTLPDGERATGCGCGEGWPQ
jgi:hypothetical protein